MLEVAKKINLNITLKGRKAKHRSKEDILDKRKNGI